MRFRKEFLISARDARRNLIFCEPRFTNCAGRLSTFTGHFPVRWYLQTEIAAAAIRRGRCKRPDWLAGEFIGSENRHLSIIGCTIFEERQQKPCQPEN